jgi:SAM-dependent methyltransferase
MERFWDARAREDPYYFVDSRLRYHSPDERAFWLGGEESLGRLLAALGAPPVQDQVVVDIGCGIGRLTRPLARDAARVIALDVSSEMLSEARSLNQHLDNVEWVHGDGRSLQPVPDASVDACISHVVFRHIPDPAITLGYIREMGRVLRPGGFAAFELSNDPQAHRPRRGRWRERIARLSSRRPRGQTDKAWLGSYVDLGDLRRVADEAGLEVERIAGESSEYCAVLLRRSRASSSSRPAAEAVAGV